MPQTTKKHVYPPALKIEAVRMFLDGNNTRREVVKHFDIASVSTLKKWVIAYRREGEAGLQGKPKGRPQGVCNRHYSPVKLVPTEDVFMRYENDRLLRKLID